MNAITRDRHKDLIVKHLQKAGRLCPNFCPDEKMLAEMKRHITPYLIRQSYLPERILSGYIVIQKLQVLFCLMAISFAISACAGKPVLEKKQERWIKVPGIFQNVEMATARLTQALWNEEKKFKLGRDQNRFAPVSQIAVGSVVNAKGYRTLLSQRIENGFVKSLEKITGHSVFPRKIITAWEEELTMKGAAGQIETRSFSPHLALRAAALGGADTLVSGKYQIRGSRIEVSAGLHRLGASLPDGTLIVARGQVNLPLDSIKLAEVIGRIPSRKRNILPVVPKNWTWNPLSVWYERIESNGRRRKGLGGANIRTSTSYLISFLPTQRIHVLVLRITSEGQAQVVFPARDANLSKHIEKDRRYGIPGRLSGSSKWVSAYVFFAKEAFLYRRDIFPAVQKLLGQIIQGSIVGPIQTNLALPSGIFQRRLWFTKSRSSLRIPSENSKASH